MNPAAKSYPDQFAITPDLLHVAVPRMEIIAEMSARGEQEALVRPRGGELAQLAHEAE